MSRPVVIVDPLSSGVELAPALQKRGIPCVALSTFEPRTSLGYGTSIQKQDFSEIISLTPNLEEVIRKLNPLAIIPGTDAAMALAERLSASLQLKFSNDPQKNIHRLHKARMQEALAEAGIPALGTISSVSEAEVEAWLKAKDLTNAPLVVKPANSAGSDKVFLIPAGGDWKSAFKRVLNEPSKLDGKFHDTAVVQEQAIGTEFAIGTVSANGKHFIGQIIQYTKGTAENRSVVYDRVEFIPFNEQAHGEMWRYTQRVLDALGVRWGAAHNEIMFTKNGPRLIETSPRMTGGPVVLFAREASGSSQADKWVEAIALGDVETKEYTWRKTVMPVFLRAKATGIVSNVEALAGISQLPTLFRPFVWFKNGDTLKETVDYLSAIGIVALSGEREDVLRDLSKIRKMEAELVIR
ncbi:MAG: ATP-grasp domain-containing protein [Bdellovibrionota bacterium]